ncbi:MAG: modification methylase PaeR7I [Deltaproteobacteria bacterium]|nr:MAG: modification methylase PaeR7I [Deltaproteobacteria bacterium]
MPQLFDCLGPAHRPPALQSAVRALAQNDVIERGAVYTRREVVDLILDLTGYSSDRPLHRMRLLEPCFGGGDFLLPAVERLLRAYLAAGGTLDDAVTDLRDALCAVELHEASFRATTADVVAYLMETGLSEDSARRLVDEWLICDDFLLTALPEGFDVIVGNPPYVRQERIPDELLSEYRRRYRTIFDRADLYVPFYERCLDLLAPQGRLGFICANRWLKNRYGARLRAKVAERFHLLFFVDMVDTAAFHSEVIAYPAITVIERPRRPSRSVVTRMASRPEVGADSLRTLAEAMLNGDPRSDDRIQEVSGVASGRDPWLLEAPDQLRLIRDLESRFPLMEEVGCRVGIGVATGADRVYIGPYDALPVEDERKLPLVMAADLKAGEIAWSGNGVVNPFEEDGRLAKLEAFPRFATYIRDNRDVISKRHVARKNRRAWYRTIDRIYASLTGTPKLLIPDIKGTATVAFDEGHFYPHHSLYFVTSETWDLHALQAVLRSSVAVLFIATYCARMAGGFLRFQAQYLRRIRLPHWREIPEDLRERLIKLGAEPDLRVIDAAVADVYGLSREEAAVVARIAEDVQVRPKG